jgi:hypothetical protein
MPNTLGRGQFAIDCWPTSDSVGEPYSEYDDNLNKLKIRAEKYITVGRFKLIQVCRRSTNTEPGNWFSSEGWDIIETLESN